ncbi:MAG: PhzF family phenazine biosynthesis isomerase [Saprospiraceae bacterium]
MKTYIVDAFTKEPFKGNPAGVCLPGESISEESMLKIAQEFGFSETAFVHQTSIPGTYTIRYFSPKKEIPLCGHATLASAKVLFSNTNHKEIHFITIENLDLLIRSHGNEIIMEFPVYDTVKATVPSAMLEALGLKSIMNTAYSPKNKIVLLEISDVDLLASLRPDYTALLSSYHDINGVLVTAPAGDKEYDYHYRYFWPWSGTNEDPVTGGVQTFLAKYWGERLNKKIMKAFQSSGRTGYMNIELHGEKVLLSSEAVIIVAGELLVFN